MSMFSAVVKEYYKDKLPEGKTKHYHFALMPCTAKKFEAKRKEFDSVTNDVITTQELIKMIKESGIMFNEIEPESVDMPFGTASGAGVISVLQAVLQKLFSGKLPMTIQEKLLHRSSMLV